ncbi:MAG: acyl-CoA dehydrogenase family protein, partial [Deltaproteobacteria bacterium]
HALAPDLARGQLASFCATEEGGAHPRAMATRLETDGARLFVTGQKRFGTMASDADVLFVLATRGARDDGTNDLALVRVPVGARGVRVENLPATPFVPEITHARVTLERVAVEPRDVFPGDGYARYLKPFRTHEDLHVHAAVLGHLLRIARLHGWPRDAIERALALVVAIRALLDARVGAAGTHLALAGVLAATGRWLEESEAHWSLVDADVRARWLRDRALLGVAGSARARRTERAWESILAGRTSGKAEA